MLATQNPIESEGTYPLPEAQVDRFLFKLIVDYPAVEDEVAVVGRAIGASRSSCSERAARSSDLLRYRERRARRSTSTATGRAYAVALADATRHPAEHGLPTSTPLIEFGASPRGPIGLIQAAQALALLRGRTHVDRRGRRATSPPTCCATGSCSPTTRSPTA